MACPSLASQDLSDRQFTGRVDWTTADNDLLCKDIVTYSSSIDSDDSSLDSLVVITSLAPAGGIGHTRRINDALVPKSG